MNDKDGLNSSNSLKRQIGGNHYKNMAMQPVELIEKGELTFLAGCIIKRACRYDQKTGKGMEDLRKIIHELELLMQLRFGTLFKASIDDLFYGQFNPESFESFHQIRHENQISDFLEKNNFHCTLRGHLIDCVFWADQLRHTPQFQHEIAPIWGAAWLAAIDMRNTFEIECLEGIWPAD